ncbi:MAG: S8 family peptidase, partial [Myxococcaceae bacterium]|nr:S8 family peptidase [Myxococcaceae bacterium]
GGGSGGVGGGSGSGTSVSGNVTVFQTGSVGERGHVDPKLKRTLLEKLNAARGSKRPHVSMAPGAVGKLFSAARPKLHVPERTEPLGVHEPRQIRAGEVIVRLFAQKDDEKTTVNLEVEGLVYTHGGWASPYLQLAKYVKADGAALTEDETLRLVKTLSVRPGVKFTEPNGIRHALAVPNDSLYPAMWHLPPINMPAAWDIEKGDMTRVTVAVVDTGIYLHPDLVSRAVTGVDMISEPSIANDGDGRDNDPTDPGGDQPQGRSSWHGTHCAGTIGAAANNMTGVAGVNWNARIVPVRVLGKGGGTDFDIAAGMNWAAGGSVPGVPANQNPAAVVSMSLGGQGGPTQTYQDIIDAAAPRNVIFVVAAGNDNVDASGFTPCNQTGVLCIGATRFNGKRASYSNFGNRIDVMAPGGELAEDANSDEYPDGVLSTFKDDSNGQPTYSFQNGTSMACPHVAGIVSLMKARNANLTFAQVKDALTQTANTASRCTEGCGAGLVNVLGALQRISGQAPTGPARMSLSTTDLSFSPAQTQATLQFSNTGGMPLNVTLAASGAAAANLGASSTTATVAPGGTETVTIGANLMGLAMGSTTTGQIDVTSNGGAATVNVKIRMVAASTRAAAVALIFVDPQGMWQVASETMAPSPQFGYSLSAAPGEYFLLGAQDTNGNDNFEENEPIGLYPTFDSPKPVVLTAGQALTGYTFTLSPHVEISDDMATVIGAACTDDTPCAPGVCGTAFPGGYCTQDCSVDSCPLGSRCITGDTFAACLKSCTTPRAGQGECRGGYVCEDDGTGSGVCVPACTATSCAPATCGASGYCE